MKKIAFVLSLTLSILLLFSTPAYAGDGNGKSVPELKSSTPADGDTDVSLNSEVKLIFTNNITNQSVRDNNINCIKLIETNGDSVVIEISMADDQIEPDKKEEAVVIPKSPLKPDTEYTIVIAAELTSKNGVQAGKETIVSFKTEAVASEVVVTQDIPKTGDNTFASLIMIGISAVLMMFLLMFTKKKDLT